MWAEHHKFIALSLHSVPKDSVRGIVYQYPQSAQASITSAAGGHVPPASSNTAQTAPSSLFAMAVVTPTHF